MEEKEENKLQNEIKEINGEIRDNKERKKRIIIISSIVIIICIIIIFTKLVLPNIYILNINKNYEKEKFEKVAIYNSVLNDIEGYLKNSEERYNEIQYKVKYSSALVLMKNKDYENALKELESIMLKDEEINNLINDCKYELGKKCLEEENYQLASKYLQQVKNKDDVKDLLDTTYFNSSLKYLEENNYSRAIEEIGKVENKKYENLDETSRKIHYEYGKYYFDEESWENAINQFEYADGYKDTKKYMNKAKVAQAEEYIENDDLLNAKIIYDEIPADTEFDGVKASTRQKQLNKIKDAINATGKKYATKSYAETRNVWKYDGRWDSWYLDDTDQNEYIETTIELNDDGTFNLQGEVYFYAFDDFSSLAEYCQASIVSKTINIRNVKKIPSKYELDSNTDLIYSNGTFSIKFYEKDNYSTNFYNIYSTSVTY